MKKTKNSLMTSLFRLDSKWLRSCATIFDYMCLNLLFCLTCLPILTIGIAKLALYTTLVNDHLGKSENLLADYISHCKSYRQRGFLIGSLENSLIGVILLDLSLVWTKSKEPVRKLFKKSFILLSLHFPWSFAFLASLGINIIILKQSLFIFLLGLSIFLVIGVCGIGYLYMRVMERILK